MFDYPKSLTPEQQAELLLSWKKQIPALTSGVQVQAVLAAYDAFRFVVNSLLSEDKAKEAEARTTLETAFDVTKKITGVLGQLKDVPEAATGTQASSFSKPMVQEDELQAELLAELSAFTDLDAMVSWYASNRSRIDDVKTPSLRNPLIDTIRAKKVTLSRA